MATWPFITVQRSLRPRPKYSWATTQPWFTGGDTEIDVIGAFRFDDPESQVGIETHVVAAGDSNFHIPMTYRAEPLVGAEGSLMGTMEHSALGTRYVYDGLGDSRYLVMLAGVAMTGQGEALGMVVYEGQWFIAPAQIRIRGGGWTNERVSVDGFKPVAMEQQTVHFQNERFDLTFHRRLAAGDQPPIGLRASWDGLENPVVLAEISER